MQLIESRVAAGAAAATWTLAFLSSAPAAAQSCPNQGSARVPATYDVGPPLRCTYDPLAPSWWLYTPSHRVTVPRLGAQPGEARVLSRVMVRFRCTNLLFSPVEIVDITAHGYVFDIEEHPCGYVRPPRWKTDV